MPSLSRCYSTVSSVTSDLFRATMSRVSSQAMILTSASPNTKKSQLHGMTLSSVCSLSLSPQPLLQFNLHLPSYTSTEVHKNKYVAIHLLPPTPKSVQLGRIFSSGVKRERVSEKDKAEFPCNVEVATTDVTGEGDGDFHEMTTPFSQLSQDDWEHYSVSDEMVVPVLKDHECVMLCEAIKNVKVGSHEIWVVKVFDILRNGAYEGKKTGGLIYFDRQFHEIGSVIGK